MQGKALYHILKCLLLTNDSMETGCNSVIFLLAIWLFLSQWHVANVITAKVTH